MGWHVKIIIQSTSMVERGIPWIRCIYHLMRLMSQWHRGPTCMGLRCHWDRSHEIFSYPLSHMEVHPTCMVHLYVKGRKYISDTWYILSNGGVELYKNDSRIIICHLNQLWEKWKKFFMSMVLFSSFVMRFLKSEWIRLYLISVFKQNLTNIILIYIFLNYWWRRDTKSSPIISN